MQIDKILIVESPVHLWRLLSAKNEIIDHSAGEIYELLMVFMDSAESYVKGCRCDEDQNYSDMVSRYQDIRSGDVIEHLVKGFECDRIEFK